MPTKFYVVDSDSKQTYEYAANGYSLSDETWSLDANSRSSGATSNADGSKVWVVDTAGRVVIYDGNGGELGSWVAKPVRGNKNLHLQGIATDGTDIWVLGFEGEVNRYADAASRMSGEQRATSSFDVDTDPDRFNGLTTDGNTIWVVSSYTDRVHVYTTDGVMQGDWALISANTGANGLTINPDPSDETRSIWVVDAITDRVYEYQRDTGVFIGDFGLDTNAGNVHPSGIADPPPPTDSVRLNNSVNNQSDLFTEENNVIKRGGIDIGILAVSPNMVAEHTWRSTIMSSLPMESNPQPRLDLAASPTLQVIHETDLLSESDQESIEIGLPENSIAKSDQPDWTGLDLTDKLFGDFDRLLDMFDLE